MTIVNPKIEGFAEQLGVSAAPIFCWGYAAEERGLNQKAYQLIVRDRNGVVYDSGKVCSSASQGIAYTGEMLRPCTKYTWDLHVWNDNGSESESLGMSFVTGVDNWHGKWISSGKAKPFYARRTFSAQKEIASAYAFVCGLGQFKLFLNGENVSDHELDPGWTDYNKRAQYVTFDITSLVIIGENAVGISIGNGWYSPDRVNHFYFSSEPFSDRLALICDIVLEYADGTREIIASDESWRVRDSATTVANVYGSEFYDARLYPDGWNTAVFDDSNWGFAVLSGRPKGALVPQSQPPLTVKRMRIFSGIQTVQPRFLSAPSRLRPITASRTSLKT